MRVFWSLKRQTGWKLLLLTSKIIGCLKKHGLEYNDLIESLNVKLSQWGLFWWLGNWNCAHVRKMAFPSNTSQNGQYRKQRHLLIVLFVPPLDSMHKQKATNVMSQSIWPSNRLYDGEMERHFSRPNCNIMKGVQAWNLSSATFWERGGCVTSCPCLWVQHWRSESWNISNQASLRKIWLVTPPGEIVSTLCYPVTLQVSVRPPPFLYPFKNKYAISAIHCWAYVIYNFPKKQRVLHLHLTCVSNDFG